MSPHRVIQAGCEQESLSAGSDVILASQKLMEGTNSGKEVQLRLLFFLAMEPEQAVSAESTFRLRPCLLPKDLFFGLQCMWTQTSYLNQEWGCRFCRNYLYQLSSRSFSSGKRDTPWTSKKTGDAIPSKWMSKSCTFLAYSAWISISSS